jgi:hypothetical protein
MVDRLGEGAGRKSRRSAGHDHLRRRVRAVFSSALGPTDTPSVLSGGETSGVADCAHEFVSSGGSSHSKAQQAEIANDNAEIKALRAEVRKLARTH